MQLEEGRFRPAGIFTPWVGKKNHRRRAGGRGEFFGPNGLCFPARPLIVDFPSLLPWPLRCLSLPMVRFLFMARSRDVSSSVTLAPRPSPLYPLPAYVRDPIDTRAAMRALLMSEALSYCLLLQLVMVHIGMLRTWISTRLANSCESVYSDPSN